MAFSGGGQAITRPHTHDATILQDGGTLNFQNITQGNMAAGSVTQSDGVHMQELLIGTPTQVPRVNGAGTALEYHSPVDLIGSLELLATETLAAVGPDVEITGSWTVADYSQFILICGFSNDNSVGTPDLRFRINSSSDPVYVTNMILNTGGVLSATTTGMATSGLICTADVCRPSSTETCQTRIEFELCEQNPNNTYRWNWSNTPMWDEHGMVVSDNEQISGIFSNNFQTGLASLHFYFSDASNFRIGSTITLYGIKRN